ncbi:MAG: hypothetical protein ACOCQD_04345, partial [archaeon]
MQEESKKKIQRLFKSISILEDKITEEADKAMAQEGLKIPSVNIFTGEEYKDLYDDAQWFRVSPAWDCPDSPFGLCMYHIVHDPSQDCCVFCGHP